MQIVHRIRFSHSHLQDPDPFGNGPDPQPFLSLCFQLKEKKHENEEEVLNNLKEVEDKKQKDYQSPVEEEYLASHQVRYLVM